MAGMPPTLVLGGTSEATELAGALTARGRDVVMSFAGVTNPRDRPPFRQRIGGFGGVTGLVDELQQSGYGLLVNATHPFAVRMSRHATAAASIAGIAHLRLLRPPWQARPGDCWHEVDDLAAAARRLDELGRRRVFLSIGRMEIGAFADVPGAEYVLRSIEAPASLPLDGATVLRGRGPFSVEAELSLLRDHCVDVLVTRNSGGHATEAKLVAARQLGIPVVMVRRPDAPPVEHAATVTEALAWIEDRLPRP